MQLDNKKTKIHLLSDIDGVCFDWFKGFKDFLVDQGEFYTGELPEVFSMTDVFPYNPAPYKRIAEYQASEFYRNAPLYPEVKSAMSAIKEAGIPLTFITSCGDDAEIKRVRGNYMEKHLPGLYDDIIFLPFCDDKNNILKTFNDTDTHYFMVDDQVGVCEVAMSNGITPILKDMAYNREDNRFTRADDYSQVANYVKHIQRIISPEIEFKNSAAKSFDLPTRLAIPR